MARLAVLFNAWASLAMPCMSDHVTVGNNKAGKAAVKWRSKNGSLLLQSATGNRLCAFLKKRGNTYIFAQNIFGILSKKTYFIKTDDRNPYNKEPVKLLSHTGSFSVEGLCGSNCGNWPDIFAQEAALRLKSHFKLVKQGHTLTRLQKCKTSETLTLQALCVCVLCFCLDKITTRAFFLLFPLFPTALCEPHSWLCQCENKPWESSLWNTCIKLSQSLKHSAFTHTICQLFQWDQQPVNQSPQRDSTRLYRCVILSTPTHTELKLESIRIADGIVHVPALFLPRCFLTLLPDNLPLSSLLAVLLGISCHVTFLSQPLCIMSRWMGNVPTQQCH